MDEQHRDPWEEISYIKSILEKTADGMKAVAPWFIRFGILWMVYGTLETIMRLLSVSASVSTIQAVIRVLGVIGWVFYISLAVSFFMGRRNLSKKGGNTLGLKLMDIWGLCILLFLFLTIVLTVINFLAAHAFIIYDRLFAVLPVVKSFLIFVLPLLPLLITAVFLDNLRMLWAGIVLCVLSTAILSTQIFLVTGFGIAKILSSNAMFTAYTFVVCLLDIAPGLMLLYFGQALKRG